MQAWVVLVYLAAMGWPFFVVLAMIFVGHYEPNPHAVAVATLRL